MKIYSKQKNLELSIFSVINAHAQKHNALNLSQGFPDFDPHPDLIALVNSYMQKGYNQYAPMPGVLKLREAISEKGAKLYGSSYHPEHEITVTAGATAALFAAISAFAGKDDEVIIFEPFYDAYVPVVEYNGAKPVYIKMEYPEYKIDWLKVEQAISPATKMMIFNSPNNPSGSLLSADDIENIIRLTRNTDIVLISDEVYEHIVFDEAQHLSFMRYPQLSERSLVISSFGKTYHTTGWKMGYCAAPMELSAEFRKMHQFVTYAVSTPIQYAYAEFMKQENHYLELNTFYQQKRDYFQDIIKASRFKLLPCPGTYFQLLDYSGISDEDELPFARRLIEEYTIASIPTSPFYSDRSNQHALRFCFAKQDSTLDKAADILCKI